MYPLEFYVSHIGNFHQPRRRKNTVIENLTTTPPLCRWTTLRHFNKETGKWNFYFRWKNIKQKVNRFSFFFRSIAKTTTKVSIICSCKEITRGFAEGIFCTTTKASKKVINIKRNLCSSLGLFCSQRWRKRRHKYKLQRKNSRMLIKIK